MQTQTKSYKLYNSGVPTCKGGQVEHINHFVAIYHFEANILLISDLPETFLNLRGGFLAWNGWTYRSWSIFKGASWNFKYAIIWI